MKYPAHRAGYFPFPFFISQEMMRSQKSDFALSVSILGALKIFPASAGLKLGIMPSNS